MTSLEKDRHKEPKESQPLAGKVGLVTGGSRDIGEQITRELAKKGASIIVAYREKQKRADAVKKDLDMLGVKSEFVQGDITDEQGIKKLEETVVNSFGGKLDFLILNAPVFSKDPTDAKSPNEHLTDALLPFMSEGGVVIFMQSVPGHYEPELRDELLNNENVAKYAQVARDKYRDEQSLTERTEKFKKQGVLFIVVCPPIVEDTSNMQLFFKRNQSGGLNLGFAEAGKNLSKKLGLPETITKAEVGKKVAEVLMKRKDLPMGYIEFFKPAQNPARL